MGLRCSSVFTFKVLSEGLRVGAVPFTVRVCTKPWRIPDDGFVIPKDMKVFIPTVRLNVFLKTLLSNYYMKPGLHYDEKYWAEPYKFDPERFNSENKGKINGAVYQPFGYGPRSNLSTILLRFISHDIRACLGQNLLKMETKIMLTQLLRNFRYSLITKILALLLMQTI